MTAAAVALVLASTSVSAHRRDEFLQAARIGIEERRVELELSLTPGIAVADAVIGDIDRNRDGSLSEEEKSTYLREVLSSLQLAIDGQPLQINIVASTFPALDALRTGDAAIEVRSMAELPPLSSGAHHVSFNNAHRRDSSVYLTNALAPENDRIAIVAQRRDPDQRATTIDYEIAPAAAATLPLWLFVPALAWVFVRRNLLPMPFGRR